MISNIGITPSAAKFIMKFYLDEFNKTGIVSAISPIQLVEQYDLYIADGWTILGYCIVTCLNNSKLLDQYLGGKIKMLDTLVGMTVKLSNMTADAATIKDLLPVVIERYFRNKQEN